MRIKVYPVKAKSRTYYRLKWKNAATGKWVYESTKHVRSRDAQRAAKEREANPGATEGDNNPPTK